ncbi:MAG: YoaK family protein [Candidatus Binataceae bacterium]
MRAPTELTVLQKVWIALILTWAAGFVDLVGYISLYGIYVAHMTGNTVSLARHVSREEWSGCARRGWPIATFIFGLVLGAVVADAEKRRVIRVPFPALTTMEIVLVAIFLWAGSGNGFWAIIPPQPAGKFYLMVALLTIAMGIQNVAIRSVGGLNVYTTFVTGSLVKFAESLSTYLFWLRERTRKRARSRRRVWRVIAASRRQPSLRRAALTFSLWLVYLGGGICGASGTDRWALLSLVAPLGVWVFITAYGAFRPFMHVLSEEF